MGEGGRSYKSQTGEMVPVLTGTDLLPSPQGHKVSLLMHAVKGNLANTVCKRKHQHIASVLVLGRPCMLFSNFDSFLRGQGRVREGVMDFFFPPPLLVLLPPPSSVAPSLPHFHRGVTLTQSQGEVALAADRTACFPNPGKGVGASGWRAADGALQAGLMRTHTFSRRDIRPRGQNRPTNISDASDHLASELRTHYA